MLSDCKFVEIFSNIPERKPAQEEMNKTLKRKYRDKYVGDQKLREMYPKYFKEDLPS